jgi:hypothetical protein
MQSAPTDSVLSGLPFCFSFSDHQAVMVGSTAGGSNHGTSMLYMNALRKVSLVDPLFVRSHDSADTVCCNFMLTRNGQKSRILWLTDEGA